MAGRQTSAAPDGTAIDLLSRGKISPFTNLSKQKGFEAGSYPGGFKLPFIGGMHYHLISSPTYFHKIDFKLHKRSVWKNKKGTAAVEEFPILLISGFYYIGYYMGSGA